MRFCSLGSGSRGNAFVVEHRATTVLVDCGFSAAQLCKRLAQKHLSGGEIDAVLLSHEHNDHAAGAEKWCAQHGVPVYMTAGTARQLNFSAPWIKIVSGVGMDIGDLHITPVTVPHDAAEPVQFVVEDGASRLGLFTDFGHLTSAIRAACRRLNALIIETNHHPPLLRENRRYPAALRRRIGGDYGHLDNGAAARLAAEIDDRHLRWVVAAHLSESNNTPQLVAAAMAAAVDLKKILVADQQHGVGWLRA